MAKFQYKDTYLFGLNYSNRDFTDENSFGKNVFTNAFPVSLIQYMNSKGIDPVMISAAIQSGELTTISKPTKLSTIIGCEPGNAHWSFETVFEGYQPFTDDTPARSDVVVTDLATGKQTKAFEIKLVTVPNSATAYLPRRDQSCELVARPASIEQLCFSIADSYGLAKRHELGDIIAAALRRPMDYEWRNETYMRRKLPRILDAATAIAEIGIEYQSPFALTGMWRTKGQSPAFDEECFDAFFWTDMAFLQLFTNVTKNAIEKEEPRIPRPARSVIWLVKCLFDYSAQSRITFSNARRDITYGGQTDKAGSFSGPSTLKFTNFKEFFHPRIPSNAYEEIVSPEAIAMLKPERRLDASIVTASLIKRKQS